MLEFSEMSQKEFETYLETAVDHLADEISKARDLSQEEGKKAALASFKSLFPDNLVKSKDQYVHNLVAERRTVGIIHFGVKQDKKLPYVYLWDIVIDPSQRGKGYGGQAMVALEKEVRKLGFKSIRLNVFGHNFTAIKLYEKMGYTPESLALVKYLGETD